VGRSPFTIGLTGGLGLAVAYVIYRIVVDVSTVLMVVGLSLFIAMGLSPVLEWLVRRKLVRLAAVLLVALLFVLVVVGFVAAALSPLSHEVHQLSRQLPRYRKGSYVRWWR
jgi:predicted PurR-regulated permease PerM